MAAVLSGNANAQNVEEAIQIATAPHSLRRSRDRGGCPSTCNILWRELNRPPMTADRRRHDDYTLVSIPGYRVRATPRRWSAAGSDCRTGRVAHHETKTFSATSILPLVAFE